MALVCHFCDSPLILAFNQTVLCWAIQFELIDGIGAFYTFWRSILKLIGFVVRTTQTFSEYVSFV